MARSGNQAPPGPPLSIPASAAGWPVWGHDAAVRELRRAIGQDRIAHAYLIAGPDGVGKATLALAFAQTVCCRDDARSDRTVPCGACLACRKIARGVHPDVQTFDLARQAAAAEKSGGKNTSLTIETVRELTSTVALRPMEAPRRFVLIDDAETMQGAAQEALLKTLEEPPSAVVLLLLADDAEALLPTIRSRCRLVPLQPVPRPTVLELLRAAAGPVAGTAIEATAVLANGRPGWALRAVADRSLVAEREAAVERGVAWIAGSGYDRLVAAVRLGDSFGKRRQEVFADLETLLGLWRDALLLRAGLPEHAVYAAQAGRLGALAGGWELPAVARAVGAVQACIADLEANVRPRLALESMVLEWPPPTPR